MAQRAFFRVVLRTFDAHFADKMRIPFNTAPTPCTLSGTPIASSII